MGRSRKGPPTNGNQMEGGESKEAIFELEEKIRELVYEALDNGMTRGDALAALILNLISHAANMALIAKSPEKAEAFLNTLWAQIGKNSLSVTKEWLKETKG